MYLKKRKHQQRKIKHTSKQNKKTGSIEIQIRIEK